MNGGNLYQLKYWNELCELKIHLFYLDEYFACTEKKDRWVEVFLALVSSSSIATWAVWQQYQFVWALIIAASQVVSAVKRFLPYKKRMQIIPKLRREMEILFLDANREWYDVAEGNLTQREIHELQCKIKERKAESQHKYLANTALPFKQKYMDKAEQNGETYFKNYHSMEE